MMRYSVQPRIQIFVTGCGFLSFTKNMCKNIGKNIPKNLSGKYIPGTLAMCQKLLDHGKNFTTDALKTSSKRVIQREIYLQKKDKKFIDNLRSILIV